METRSARVALAIERLRAEGERLTPGRRAVIEVLDLERRHLDAEAIAARVAVREPGVHRATVYRSLQALVEAGLVSHTHVPGGATIYHLALHAHPSDANEGAATKGSDAFHAHGHAHLQCVSCERFTDVPTSEFAELIERVRSATGFVIDAEHAALLGTCAECADKPDIGER